MGTTDKHEEHEVKRHLIWIITGVATVGLAVPAVAAMQSTSAADDDGTPGDVRGNCDEPEHADDRECLTVIVPARAVTTPTTASSVSAPRPSAPSTTTPASVPSAPPSTTPASGSVVDGRGTANTVPVSTVAGSGLEVATTGSSVPTAVPGDLSGPCDEAEHANDPRCAGSAPVADDTSGHGGDDDGDDDRSGHGSDDRGGDDDRSGHGGDDGSGDDDSGRHGGDD